VALKTSEGIGRFVRDALRESLNRTVTAQVGALLSRRAFNDFRRRLDYTEYGGAPLLGVRGVCIIGHGSSNEKAIFNGIRVAYEFAKAGTNDLMEAEFAKRAQLRTDAAAAASSAPAASSTPVAIPAAAAE
jgi:glycerol-3-phosphate acyltransferase PlsX